VAALYKEVEGWGAQYEVNRAAYRSTDIPIRSRISASPREAPPPPHTHARTTLRHHGQWRGLPHHGRKGKAPSGAQGMPPSTAVDRRRRGFGADSTEATGCGRFGLLAPTAMRGRIAREKEEQRGLPPPWWYSPSPAGHRPRGSVAGGSSCQESRAEKLERKRCGTVCVVRCRHCCELRPSPAAHRPRGRGLVGWQLERGLDRDRVGARVFGSTPRVVLTQRY
jgi:hypothetical protein